MGPREHRAPAIWLREVVTAALELLDQRGPTTTTPSVAARATRTQQDSAAPPADGAWAALQTTLARAAAATRGGDPDEETAWDPMIEAAAPFARLVQELTLSPFEVQVLVVLLAADLDGDVAGLVYGVPDTAAPLGAPVGSLVDRLCLGLGDRIAALEAFGHEAPLVRGRILVVRGLTDRPDEPLRARRVSLSGPVRAFLLGRAELSDDVAPYAQLIWPEQDLQQVILPTTHLRQARDLVIHQARVRAALEGWTADPRYGPVVGGGAVLLLSGASGTGKSLFARALAHEAGRPLLSLRTSDLPSEGLDRVLQDALSEAWMHDAVVLMEDCEHVFGADRPQSSAGLRALDEDNAGVVILTTNAPARLRDALARRVVLHVPFERPGARARRQIWEVHLPPDVPLADDVDLDVLADRYELTGGQIRNAFVVATNQALTRAVRGGEPTTLDMAALEHGCRTQLPYVLEGLTTRTPTHLGLRDVVLRPELETQLRQLLAAIQNQSFLMNAWGMGDRLSKGKGIVALFDGPPGTGKTLSAEVLAAAAGVPLHRVSLPDVVSKWVGETEKHIREVFQLARASRAMLLFDEADALFAQRSSEAADDGARHANMGVNLLLQEIELFPGVCVLTTNLYGRLDTALRRRILFRIQFEAPDEAQRERIWQTLWPSKMPRARDVDLGALARSFDMAGGFIKNALLRAGYAACERGGVVDQATLEAACQHEMRAMGRVVRDPAAARRDRARRAARLQEVVRHQGGGAADGEAAP